MELVFSGEAVGPVVAAALDDPAVRSQLLHERVPVAAFDYARTMWARFWSGEQLGGDQLIALIGTMRAVADHLAWSDPEAARAILNATTMVWVDHGRAVSDDDYRPHPADLRLYLRPADAAS